VLDEVIARRMGELADAHPGVAQIDGRQIQ
jgi:hypothetical protein